MSRQKSSSVSVVAILLLVCVLVSCMCGILISFGGLNNKQYNPWQAIIGGMMGGLVAGIMGGLIGLIKGNSSVKASRLGPLPWHEYPRDLKALREKHLDND
jgi:hypothetical protein